MQKELETKYTPSQFEEKIYQIWQKAGYFKPEINSKGKPFTIIMPPPNVTGILHMGHALFVTLEDLMTRYRRMGGRAALWLPGMDHAGIATQTVVKKKLDKEGINFRTLGREKFVKEVWEWKKEHGGVIVEQIKKLGASCDWSREKFTLNPDLSEAVSDAFVRLYKKGLIYRGLRTVNWCPRCQTAISDDEVEYQKEKGKLYWIKYGPFILATARPETKLGDTAVAVHPGDKRYRKMVGKKYQIPGVLGNFEIVVVADNAVDPKFGSGAIKVTPAHSSIDFEIAERHHIPSKQVIDKYGKMMENTGKYAGMKTAEARVAIVADMKKMGLIEKIDENYEHNLAVCYRCGGKIEPIPSKQWFIKIKPLAEKAKEAVKLGKIKIIPKRFEKIYFHWLDNIRDWCISRQLWWGHRLPVWYRLEGNPKSVTAAAGSRNGGKILNPKPDETENPDIYVGIKPPKDLDNWQQDEDVLDTWFSSALWPFSTLGWPNENADDFKKFYPTDVMETGYDILFFWVARMIMFGLFFTDEVPFKTIYLHGLVRDEKGKKMSKSLGNVLNPLDLSNQYGADALRFSLVVGASPGKDINFALDKIKGSRNFINKIWNASRFVMMNLSAGSHPEESRRGGTTNGSQEKTQGSFATLRMTEKEMKLLGEEKKKKLKEFEKFKEEITEHLENFKFSLAGEKLRDYFWHDFCDKTIESVKVKARNEKDQVKKQALEQYLLYLLTEQLKLLHPFVPFVTEELWQMIWQKLGIKKEPLIITDWPK